MQQRKVRKTYLSVFTSLVLFVSISLYLSRDYIPPGIKDFSPSSPSSPRTLLRSRSNNLIQFRNFAIQQEQEDEDDDHHRLLFREIISPPPPPPPKTLIIKPDSILFPDWEAFLVTSPENHRRLSSSSNRYSCVFRSNDTSPLKFAGILPFSNQSTFKCLIPSSARRTLPFYSPVLMKSPPEGGGRGGFPESDSKPPAVMFRWGFLAYQSISTKNNVILFVKGVNSRQGNNRSPLELRCVYFRNGFNYSVRTSVISSNQEVFRCERPNVTVHRRLFFESRGEDEKIKVSLEIFGGENQNQKRNTKGIVPSVAYYTPPPPPMRSLAGNDSKSLICACTMVYNVAKFLKEWVLYHSKIGVEKFILYDNGSDDNLQEIVKELLEGNYNVETLVWPWQKTQEAGFSHCSVYAKDSCTWMMFIDVDEFIFSPSWLNSSYPSTHMLKSLLPTSSEYTNSSSLSSSSRSEATESRRWHQLIGEILIRCLEYGPSNQSRHPIEGVTQGYTCRRKTEQRHKSIVLIDAIDTSLVNVVHHFQLKEGYRMKKLSLKDGVVNHYKYQAWSEFKLKFRRRVSAYVVDWRQGVNPRSQDRTPGLGFEPIEPEGWANRFCEVNDSRLKMVTSKWFGFGSLSKLG